MKKYIKPVQNQVLMAKSKGRPPQSEIRQNMIELLHYLGSDYGYQICKNYFKVFPPVTRRVIYYHLKKGLDLGEFAIDRVEKEQGEYSWGTMAEKIYYKLGKKAKPRGNPAIKEALRKPK